VPITLQSGGYLLQQGGGRILLRSDVRARLVVFAEAIVEAIQDGWATGEQPASVTTVSRRWVTRESENQLASMGSGRKVWVFGVGYSDESLTRGRDFGEYRVTIDTVRRYTEAAEFPDYWVDDEIAFVQSEVWDKLSDPRAAEIIGGYFPDAGSVSVVVDEAMLAANKVFWCRVELTFKAIQ
jgi:hypothetical protein